MPLHQPSPSNNNRKTSKLTAAGEEKEDSAESSEEEEEQQQQQEGYMFNGKLYPTYQEMVAAKHERNRKVLERTTSEISLMLGSEYSSSKGGIKKKPPSKKLALQEEIQKGKLVVLPPRLYRHHHIKIHQGKDQEVLVAAAETVSTQVVAVVVYHYPVKSRRMCL